MSRIACYRFQYAERERSVGRLAHAGKFKEAQQMDIDDLRAKFGNKYDTAIEEMLNFTNSLRFRKGSNIPMNPTPKVIRRGGA